MATAARPALDYESCDELTLVRHAKNGDEKAFAELYLRNYARVQSTCASITRNVDILPDLTNETFMKAWQKLPLFQEKAAFSTWVTRIAINEALQWLRRFRRRDISSLDQILANPKENTMELAAEDSRLRAVATREIVQSALLRIPYSMRGVIVLRYIEGMSSEELGDAFGITPKAAKSHLFRSKAEIKKVLIELLSNQ
jgi:RNA polymerase sigma-70 factor (ECF subfamily)